MAFSDVNNTLGMGGKIIQQTGPTTWLMHLNDAAHYTLSSSEANNILTRLRLEATPLAPQPTLGKSPHQAASRLTRLVSICLSGFSNSGTLSAFHQILE